MIFFVLCRHFQDYHYFFKNVFQNIRISNSLDLDQAQGILVQTVCQGYKQRTLVGKGSSVFTGLQIRVLSKIIFQFLILPDICCGYSKEPSQ